MKFGIYRKRKTYKSEVSNWNYSSLYYRLIVYFFPRPFLKKAGEKSKNRPNETWPSASRDFFARPHQVRCPWNFSKNCQSCSNWRSFVVTVRWDHWCEFLGTLGVAGCCWENTVGGCRHTAKQGDEIFEVFWPCYIGIKVSRETRIPSWTNQYVMECHVKVLNVANGGRGRRILWDQGRFEMFSFCGR